MARKGQGLGVGQRRSRPGHVTLGGNLGRAAGDPQEEPAPSSPQWPGLQPAGGRTGIGGNPRQVGRGGN